MLKNNLIHSNEHQLSSELYIDLFSKQSYLENEVEIVSNLSLSFKQWLEHVLDRKVDDFLKEINSDDLAERAKQIRLHDKGIVLFRLKKNTGLWLEEHFKKTVVDGVTLVESIVYDRTELIQLKENLESSNQNLQSVLENSPAVFFRCLNNDKQQILFINHAIESITGQKSDYLIDKGREYLLQQVHPADKDRLRGVLHHAQSEMGEYQVEYQIISVNQKMLHVLEQGKFKQHPIKKEISFLDASITDISRTKTVQIQLQESQQELKEAQNIAKIGSWYFCFKSKNIRWSEETYRIFELDLSFDVTMDSVSGCFTREAQVLIGKVWEESIRTQEGWDIELKIHDDHDENKWLRMRGEIEFIEGKPLHARGIFQDISDKKSDEERLILAKETAEKASRSKAEFLSTMSHEIRTPMNAVIGATNLLLDDEPREDQIANLNTLQFSAENLLVLINDILDFSKIEAGKIDFEEIDFSLETLLNSLYQALNIKAQEKELLLELNVANDVPKAVVGDPTRLNQILTNLIGNAIKFTKTGSVSMNVSLLYKKQDKLKLLFEVVDTGIGIDDDKINQIFESFSQENSGINRNFGGTGLGLAITKRLLEMQNTSIQVESVKGKGSTFYFELDLEVSTRNFQRKSETNQIKFEQETLQGYKILLVEDNAINVMIARQFLEKWGMIVDHAENGLYGVEKVVENDFDLVLMDLQMPVMNGYESAMAIRKLEDKEKASIPIFALTASAMLEIQDQVFECGMDNFITKPFNPQELYSKMAKALQKN